ncbi:EamA family transporter [Kitasatospora sp. NPDC056327]|uniref:EamA family transporter n=1 Tax=Kitasatospora sp. NPDC056327 TaxID=3345785 RepID=UPI0035D63B08
MLRNRLAIVLLTALAPAIWGSTYLVTTELLPPGRPLLAGVLRALPAGLLLIALTRRLPKGGWWWRSLVLGALNIGAFFALLFVAAYRLPGGVAATVGAVQPLIAAGLSVLLLGDRLSPRTLVSGIAGVAGVSLLVLRADARLDALGVAAALGGAVVMATGVVLSKRWTSPAPLLATTGWQLTAGGLLLLPVALLVEGPPPSGLTGANLLGYGYLGLIGAAVAYALWFRGIRALPPTSVTFLALLSPVVATALGWLVLGQDLSPVQAVGAVIVLGSLVAAQTQRPRTPARPVAGVPGTGPAAPAAPAGDTAEHADARPRRAA